MDAYALRQRVIASNIANITTSGYRSRSVEFEEQLGAALGSAPTRLAMTNELHMSLNGGAPGDVRPTVVDTPDLADNASGVNNVDIDHEMAELAKNQIRFKFAARLVTDAFRGIQKSIRGTIS
jgi:flagellar basal-body rod protein FlgB